VRRAGFVLLALTVASLSVFAASAACAQEQVPVAMQVQPRIVTANDLKQLMLFDPHHDRFKVDAAEEEEDRERIPPNGSADYARYRFDSLVPVPTPAPTDGPLAARAAQAFAYQPHLTTSFAIRDSITGVPADCTIGAGPSHIVAAYNTFVAFYTKAGQLTFFSSLDGFLDSRPGWKSQFDPKVVYDEGSGRFFVISLNYNLTARQSDWSVAVSRTSDPNQGWYVYADMRTELDGQGIDYEDIGFGPRGLYLCGNYIQFQEWGALPALPPNNPGHTDLIWVMDKAAMMAGQTVTIYSFLDLPGDANKPTFLPRVAQVHGAPPAGLDGFLSAWQPAASPANTLRVSVYGVTLPANFPLAGPSLNRQTVDIVQPAGPINPPQLGGKASLQTNGFGSSQLTLYYRNGTLTMPFPEGAGAVSGSGVLQLGVNWPSLNVAYRTNYNDGTNGHIYPNAAVNSHGQMGLSFGRSGALEYASARCATRTIDDPSFLPSLSVHDGQAYVGNPVTDLASTLYRWGDYSGVAVDPVSQGFWYFGMYAFDRGNFGNSNFKLWAGYMPRAVYADASWFGSQAGTAQRPWNAFFSAMNDADNTDELVMKPGIYHTPGIIVKPVTIIADGGTVQIQYP
jgi:hypothetical protein